MFGGQGSHSEVQASLGGVFQATWTRPPLRNLANAGALGGVAAGKGGAPKSRSRGCLSPASLVPCPVPRDQISGRLRQSPGLRSHALESSSLLSCHSVRCPGACHVPFPCEKWHAPHREKCCIKHGPFLERRPASPREHYHPGPVRRHLSD